MNGREHIELRVVEILRESALNHSTRALDLDAPLGEAGIGLDSLALVQFLTALEAEYGVRLPLDFWADADRVSLRRCAGEILALHETR